VTALSKRGDKPELDVEEYHRLRDATIAAMHVELGIAEPRVAHRPRGSKVYRYSTVHLSRDLESHASVTVETIDMRTLGDESLIRRS